MKMTKKMGILSKSIREYKKPSFLSPLFIAIEALIDCFMPLVMSKFIDTIQIASQTANDLMGKILIYGFILLLMASIALFCGIMAAKYSSRASAGFAKNLRKDLFYKIQGFSFENIDKFSPSSLVTRLTTDVNNVRYAFMMLIKVAIKAPLMLIFSLSLSFTFHKTLPLIFLISAPILIIGLYFILTRAYPLFKKVFKKYDKLNNSIQENIKGIRVVKSYVREDYENKKFSKAAENIRKDYTRAEKIVSLNSPLMNFSIYLCNILISFLGAKLIITSNGALLSIGQLSSLILYTIQILSSLMMLSMVFLIMTIAGESSNRIIEVLQEKPTINNSKNPIFEVESGEVEFKNVDLKYSKNAEKFALNKVNLKINSGETIGIIGGTGSSKSSLVQLISRLYDATDGEVLVGGKNVKSYDIKTLRDNVAVVLQKNLLFSDTIKENLKWGNKDATDEEIKEVCKLARADEFIESFPNKYETMIDQGGSNVSGGQKQRLCIARALLKKPKILILDDSTSAVDTKTDSEIRKGLKTYLPNTTKIIIAQRIASVEDADKIIVMDNGGVNGFGTHKELLKNNEIYKEVYYSQNKVGGKNEK